MVSKMTILHTILIALMSVSCEMSRPKRGRRKESEVHDKTLWKNIYEEELTEAMMATKKPENHTRVVQSPSLNDNELVFDRLFSSITSGNAKHSKKIESIDYRLNRLDIEVHEKSNSILKQLALILQTINGENSCSNMELQLQKIKSDIDHIKTSFEIPRAYSKDGSDVDSALDSRINVLDTHLKSVQDGVDSIVATLSEVKNRQIARTYSDVTATSRASVPMDAMALITEFRRTLHEQKTKKCDCSRMSRVDRSERYPTDCQEIQVQGFNVSGIYKIKPEDMDPFYVLCDLTTAGGGWTVFQNRFDGSQDFYKGWHDYEYGFGNLAGEFWLGLEKLNFLTNQKLYELRIEIETQHGQDAYAGYSVFTIGPKHEGYRISTLGTFYGTAGDSLSYHAGQKFSTFDVDNDEWKDGACATEHGGAWWYKECDKSNLNGKYSQNGEETRGQSIYWISFKGPNTPLSKTKLMIRPLPASKPIDYSETNRKLLGDRKVNKPGQLEKVKQRSNNKYGYNERTNAEPYFPNLINYS